MFLHFQMDLLVLPDIKKGMQSGTGKTPSIVILWTWKRSEFGIMLVIFMSIGLTIRKAIAS